mmetsp:Transcript_67384/g.119602  ORF Transcript_67384/g.119602 Transcript_67384/m.119602 type:complete len:225 (+) Transcript_67384:59-733(+)
MACQDFSCDREEQSTTSEEEQQRLELFAKTLALELVVEEKEELQQTLHDTDLQLERVRDELKDVVVEKDELQGKLIANDLVLKQVVAEKEELRKKLFARDLEFRSLASEKEQLQHQVIASDLQVKLIESDMKLRRDPAEEAQLKQIASGKEDLQQKAHDLNQLIFELNSCRERCLREIFSIPVGTAAVLCPCEENEVPSYQEAQLQGPKQEPDPEPKEAALEED